MAPANSIYLYFNWGHMLTYVESLSKTPVKSVAHKHFKKNGSQVL